MSILIDKLSPAAIARIEERMRPGRFSASGFLDRHERLVEVVERDRRTLSELSLTPEQIADRLESVVQQAYRLQTLRDRRKPGTWSGFRALGVVEGRYEVRHEQTMGFQTCPFERPNGEQCATRNGTDFHIRCRESGQTLRFAGFAIHLIRDHHFFEGNVTYRVDPRYVAGFLNVEPGKSYAPQWEEETIWRLKWPSSGGKASNQPLPREFAEVGDRPEHKLDIGGRARLLFSDGRCLALVRHSCVLELGEINGGIWTVPELTEGTYAFELSRQRFVPPSPSGKYLFEDFPQAPRPNERAPPAQASPDEAGRVRCPGCGIRIRTNSSSYRDGRHETCGQRIRLVDPKPESREISLGSKRFPEHLLAEGIEPRECLDQGNFMDVWRVEMPPPSPGCRRSPLEPGGRDHLLRLVADQIYDEGHYAISRVSVRERLCDIATRTMEINDALPDHIVGTDCRVENGFFQGSRPWFSMPIAEQYSLAPERGSDRSWMGKLIDLAREVDELWNRRPCIPFSIRATNIFFHNNRFWLVDQGCSFWLRELIKATYDGPFIGRVEPENSSFQGGASAERPPVRQFANLWTYLRTGHGALRIEERRMIDRLRGHGPYASLKDGVSMIEAADRAVVEKALYQDDQSIETCEALMLELGESADAPIG